MEESIIVQIEKYLQNKCRDDTAAYVKEMIETNIEWQNTYTLMQKLHQEREQNQEEKLLRMMDQWQLGQGDNKG